MEFEVFARLPEVKRFRDTLQFMRKTTARYAHRNVRVLYRVCVVLKKKPSVLTPQMMADLLMRIRKKEVKIGEYEFRKVMRGWFCFKGISKDYLTNMGIGADKEYEDRSNLKFSREHRAKTIEIIKRWSSLNWSNGRITIPFADEPYLAKAIKFLPPFMYYTGTRIGEKGNDNQTGALNVLWEDVTEREDMVIIKVKDKGKKGGIIWYKQLIGAARESYEEFKREISGLPKPIRLFPFVVAHLRIFFRAVYQEVGIPKKLWRGLPLHIWRHTATQDLLWATHYNYELAAQILGWESTEVMKKRYGKMPNEEKTIGLKEAMGLPVVKEERAFLFS